MKSKILRCLETALCQTHGDKKKKKQGEIKIIWYFEQLKPANRLNITLNFDFYQTALAIKKRRIVKIIRRLETRKPEIIRFFEMALPRTDTSKEVRRNWNNTSRCPCTRLSKVKKRRGINICVTWNPFVPEHQHQVKLRTKDWERQI